MALARALAIEPELLLLDEPFGALDAQGRQELRVWLRELHEKISVTTVLVTHDQEEAMEVADRLAIINHGRLEQIGKPSEIYDHPANEFVMKFLGSATELDLNHGDQVWVTRTGLAAAELAASGASLPPVSVQAGARPVRVTHT